MSQQDFEEQLSRSIDDFLSSPEERGRRKNVRTAKPGGLHVTLAVRRHGKISDERFEHQTETISKLQARLEAEKAARDAGWPIIGYVIGYQHR